MLQQLRRQQQLPLQQQLLLLQQLLLQDLADVLRRERGAGEWEGGERERV